MSTATVEKLEGIDFENNIPCQTLKGPDWTESCGMPSVARVRYACRCGHRNPLFVCKQCLEDIRDGYMSCWKCEEWGHFTWTEI